MLVQEEDRMAGTESAALVLNATYEPLCVVSGRRAAVLVLTSKAVPVAAGDDVLHSARTAIPVPAVVRLARYVRVPYRPTVPLTRKAVFARDGGRCVYCGAPRPAWTTWCPRAAAGRTLGERRVACGRCNHVKADRGIAELGWRLRTSPRAPSGAAWRVLGARGWTRAGRRTSTVRSPTRRWASPPERRHQPEVVKPAAAGRERG
jgi:5-methylcytosine-specific restriction endonuclease McrA